MRAPSASLSPLRCTIPRTILFVFWFFGAERTERRVSPVLHNCPCSESSPLSPISHASLAPYPPKNGRSFHSELGEYYPLLRLSRMRMCVCHSREKSPFETHEMAQLLISLYLSCRFCYCSQGKVHFNIIAVKKI